MRVSLAPALLPQEAAQRARVQHRRWRFLLAKDNSDRRVDGDPFSNLSHEILPSLPSSTASTSIVALSVSISAMTSPAVTSSPSVFSHGRAYLPFAVASAASALLLAYRRSLGFNHNVSIELRGIGLRTVLCEFRRVRNDILDTTIHFLQLVFVSDFFIKQPNPHPINRVTF